MAIMTGYKHGQFSWVDLVALDMEAARHFYAQLFGWTSGDMDTQGGPHYVQFYANGHSVAGVGQMSEAMKSQGIPPTWNSYINVDDIKSVVARAEELGATVAVPITKIVDAGWMAFLQDPTGGNVGLWQKERHFGAETVNQPGSFCWNELVTRDIEKAREFFGRLLDWQFADNPHSPSKYYIIKNDGDDNGGLMQMDEAWGDIPPHWMVYFSVANADETAQRASSLGGNIFVPPFDTIVGRIAVLADPQGASFSVIQLTDPPAAE